jgi:hypothetical protein
VGASATFERDAPMKPMNKMTTNSGYEINDDGGMNRSQSKRENSAQETTRNR